MASVKCRAASMYVNGKKCGEFENTSYTIESGDEAQFGDPGYIGYSDGAITTSLSASGMHPIGGMAVNMILLMKNKTDVDVTLATIDGHIHQVTMRVTKADTKSTHKNGTQMGDYTLGGGEPVIVG